MPSFNEILAGPSSPIGAEGLLTSLVDQTKAIAESLEKSKGREQRSRSTIQISLEKIRLILNDDFTGHKS